MSPMPFTQPSAGPSRQPAAFRDIAVIANDLPCDSAALATAAALARHHGAELDVVQVLAMPLSAVDAWSLVPDPACVERYAQIREAAAKRALAFQRGLPPLGVEGRVLTFEAYGESPAGIAATAARRADLSVIARPDGPPSDASRVHDVFAALLLESGRPVLLVPAGHASPSLPPRHAVIAWSDTREAARAVHDALPLLASAETVDILMVDPVASFLEDTASFGSVLAAHLERHGVTARIVTETSRGRLVAGVILDRASRAKAQLIVAGGYGHSRLREWVIGGTTRNLFFDTPVPILFSH
ncbi:universal stress protein [Luteibacter sahnii]|uniref:universal stress protein n=1 Tax=Luteibacter sahnii TaxID=3021977 RepID=UPI002A6AE516|nr:universal stress protein [Luteibacter sp. PPL193]MDY1546949.1 universal stress protein [Luteibacter sp. PPL193]